MVKSLKKFRNDGKRAMLANPCQYVYNKFQTNYLNKKHGKLMNCTWMQHIYREILEKKFVLTLQTLFIIDSKIYTYQKVFWIA